MTPRPRNAGPRFSALRTPAPGSRRYAGAPHKLRATPPAPAAMPETIYDALRESHEIQRSLCRKLLRARPGTQDRISLFKLLHTELAAHAAAEERFLYAPALMHDAGLDSSRHALHEHHQIDELVEDLHKADAEGGQWLAVARKLSHKVHHHLREEERKFFQVTGRILSETAKQQAARRYRKDYARMLAKLRG